MKKLSLVFFIVLFHIPFLFAQENTNAYVGKEIPNLLSAVKAANPGDYILLPSGRRYVLTKEEIAIAKGEFDYKDLSGVETKVEENGTEIKTISKSHIAYVYPDGQSTHILKTGVSFTAFMNHIRETFFIADFIDSGENAHEYMNIDPPRFSVFRASAQYQTISDGIEELQAIKVTVYNFNGENKFSQYCSKPKMVWGNIDNRGSYKSIGESHQIEFDVE
jgi:hypothetical protein